MVAYEDLVVALTNWRVNQGLPVGANAFADAPTGSVDLALPVADPVELGAAEVAAADMVVEEVLDEGIEEVPAPPALEEAPAVEAVGESLDYGEETAFGEVPDMDEMAAESLAEPPALEEPPQEYEEAAFAEPPALEDPHSEIAPDMDVAPAEVPQEAQAEDVPLDADSLVVEAEAEVEADGLAIEEVAIDADDLAIEEAPVEEVSADALPAEEVAVDAYAPEEMPTKFGPEDDSEPTVMGVGVEQFVPPEEA